MNQRKRHKNAKDNSNKPKQNPPPPPPPPINRNENGEGGNDEDGGAEPIASKDHPLHWTRYAEAFCAIVLVFITGIYTYYASEQARLLRKSVEDARNAQITDERARVFAVGFHLLEEPTANRGVTVVISITNSGKTPALDVLPMTHVSGRRDDPPEVEDWDAVAKTANKQGLLPPGIGGLSTKTEPLILTTTLDAYNLGTSSIYVQGKIQYFDIFHEEQRWTTFCVVHHHGRPLNEFDFCNGGNNADRDKPK